MRGSNPRHPAHKTGALTTELMERKYFELSLIMLFVLYRPAARTYSILILYFYGLQQLLDVRLL